MSNIHKLTLDNFNEVIADPSILMNGIDLFSTAVIEGGLESMPQKKVVKKRLRQEPEILNLKDWFKTAFKRHFYDTYGEDAELLVTDIFGDEHLSNLVENVEDIKTQNDLEQSVGGEMIEGATLVLWNTLLRWRRGSSATVFYETEKRQKVDSDRRNRETLS